MMHQLGTDRNAASVHGFQSRGTSSGSIHSKRSSRSKNSLKPANIIAFINTKSGAATGGAGITLKQKLDKLLRSTDKFPKVFDLIKDKGTSRAFDIYEPNESLFIVVCGGDGSVCWVLNEIDKRIGPFGPPVAVMPLGTGNDMSRFLKWGSRFNFDNIEQFIDNVMHANIIQLDRWEAELVPVVTSSTNDDGALLESSGVEKTDSSLDFILPSIEPINNKQETFSISSIISKVPAETVSTTVFYNYFSVGVDAEVALDFHNQRNANPQLFTNRLMNLFHYARISLFKLLDKKYLFGSISNEVELQVDDVLLSEKDVKNVDGLLFLNIKTYAAGMKPWSGKCRKCKNIRRPASLLKIYDHHNRFSLSTHDFTREECEKGKNAEIFHKQGNYTPSRRRSSLTSSISSFRRLKMKGKKSFQVQHCDDGLLEIIGFRHYELANMKLGIQGRRLAQGSQIVLTIKKTMALEFDGEPVLTDPCVITIQRKNQANMLSRRGWTHSSSSNHSSSFLSCCSS